MGIKFPWNRKEEAKMEAYVYFDRYIRPLPKKKNGQFDLFAGGFDDNDVDAFRHAYVSGVFTQDFGENTANILGFLVEHSPEAQLSHSFSPRSRNMDLWNNRVGRKYGKKTNSRKKLLKLIHGAMKGGELILDLIDIREFTGKQSPPKKVSKPIISVSKSPTGRNQQFFDLQKQILLTRPELVSLIRAGEYPDYSIKIIRGIETPVSKRDSQKTNNIG
jgi:hypothetical protein